MSSDSDTGTFSNLNSESGDAARASEELKAAYGRLGAQVAAFEKSNERLRQAKENFEREVPDPKRLNSMELLEAQCKALQGSSSAILRTFGDAAGSQLEDGTVDGTKAMTYALERRINQSPVVRQQVENYKAAMRKVGELYSNDKGSETRDPGDEF